MSAVDESFFVIIPSRVIQSKLSPIQKIVCGAIAGLSSKTGSCYAKNEKIASLLGMGIHSVDCSISRLYQLGAIINIGKMKSRDLILNDEFFIGYSQNEKNGYSQNENDNSKNEKNDTLIYINKNKEGQNRSNDPICDHNFGSKKDKENAFATFWNLYPLKVKKQDTYKKFMKLKSEEIEGLINTLPAVVAYHSQELTKNTPFIPAIPHPSTFINGKRWTDSVYLSKNFLKGRAENSGIDGFDTDKFCEMIMYEDPSVYPFGVEVISRADMTFDEVLIFLEHNTVDDLFELLKRTVA